MPIENFGQADDNQCKFMEGEVYLKTKSEKFKQHWGVLIGNELYCYRRRTDSDHRMMHCLVGIFIKEMPDEVCSSSGKTYYAIKLMVPPNKSRALYFSS